MSNLWFYYISLLKFPYIHTGRRAAYAPGVVKSRLKKLSRQIISITHLKSPTDTLGRGFFYER
jgi:hypothetical protein